jgi:hypothetical protein
VRLEPFNAPTHLRVDVPTPVDFVRGCRTLPLVPGTLIYRVELRCPVGDVSSEQLRYRLSLADAADWADVSYPMRGVVYAGKGDDVVGADRVYGGLGDDHVFGRRVYGGPGRDYGAGDDAATGQPVLFGGSGKDELRGPGRLYGGAGDDHLSDLAPEGSGDMFIGGPGRDVVRLYGDGRRDVVRLRGGGADRVVCGELPAGDVLFVDRSDRLDPDCSSARVLLTERPRYPY